MPSSFLTALLDWSAVIPAAFLCFAPMKGFLKTPVRTLMLKGTGMLLILLTLMSYIEARFQLMYNSFLVPLLIASFIFFKSHIKASFAKALAVFTSVCTLMAFIANMAIGYDAALHPASDLNHFSLQATVLQLELSCIFTLLFFYPAYRYGSSLIKNLELDHIWYMVFFISSLFLFVNLMISPQKYETLHVNKVFLAYIAVMGIFFLLYLLLMVIFYHIVGGMINYARANERNRILEMQESQYQVQQRYIEDSARVRHDFKHTVHTLKELADAGDIKAINSYLDSYLKDLPQKDTLPFTQNAAVNAVLNYYLQKARSQGTKAEWDISYPPSTSISDSDMCSILGNILENAILACGEATSEKPFIDLTINHEAGSAICIAVANTVGTLKIRNGQYLSTHKNGQGIGLNSIRTIASKHNGTARFSHEGNEFYSEVILPL